jgi:dihydrofolate reductase
MRKLIVQQWVTVDNIAAEGNGGLSFVTAQSFAVSKDEGFKTSAMEFIETVDTMVLGANTYAMFKDYWPSATSEGAFGEKLNRLNKIVVSTKLSEAPWRNYSPATIVREPVNAILELKRQTGKDIVLWGSLTLMQALFDAKIVDEVQLRVCPTTRGKGVRIFNNQQDMKLIEAKSFSNGVVLLRYNLAR